MKTIRLIIHRITDLFFRNRLVFSIFVISQIIIIYSYLFFFNIAFKNYASYIANCNSIKTISVSFPQSPSGTYNDRLINTLKDNGIVKIEDIRFYFLTDNTKKGLNTCFVSYLNKCKNNVFKGKCISEKNVRSSDCVIVINEINGDKNLNVGDIMQINNNPFKVIGIRPSFANCEIPYSTGLRHFLLAQIHIILPSDTTDNQKKAFGEYVSSHVEGVKVELPKNILASVLVKMFFPLITSIFVAIISVLSLLFMYRFMMEKIRWSYIVMRLYGCSIIKSILIIYSQLIIIFTGCFFIGMTIFLLTKNMIITIETESLNIIDLNYFSVYVFFITMLTIVFTPFIYTFNKKELINITKKFSK